MKSEKLLIRESLKVEDRSSRGIIVSSQTNEETLSYTREQKIVLVIFSIPTVYVTLNWIFFHTLAWFSQNSLMDAWINGEMNHNFGSYSRMEVSFWLLFVNVIVFAVGFYVWVFAKPIEIKT